MATPAQALEAAAAPSLAPSASAADPLRDGPLRYLAFTSESGRLPPLPAGPPATALRWHCCFVLVRLWIEIVVLHTIFSLQATSEKRSSCSSAAACTWAGAPCLARPRPASSLACRLAQGQKLPPSLHPPIQTAAMPWWLCTGQWTRRTRADGLMPARWHRSRRARRRLPRPPLSS